MDGGDAKTEDGGLDGLMKDIRPVLEWAAGSQSWIPASLA